MVRWTEAQFFSQLRFVAMLYLGVAHFGRGRGVWQDPNNNPGHWEKTLDKFVEESKSDWSKLWRKGGVTANKEKLEKAVGKSMEKLLSESLKELYKDASDIL